MVILKHGLRLCGEGGSLATAPLVQSKSYFEVVLQQTGQWSVGLATRNTNLEKSRGGTDEHSWTLASDNQVWNRDTVLHTLHPAEGTAACAEGDKQDETQLVEFKSGADLRVGGTSGIPTEGDTIGVSYDHVEINFYLNGKNLEIPVLLSVREAVYPVLYGKLAAVKCKYVLLA